MTDPKLRTASTAPKRPSLRKQSDLPSGLKSSVEGMTKSFVRAPDVGDNLSQENSKRDPGRSCPCRSSSLSAPSRARDEQRMRASVCSTSPRMRASLGTAASTSSAPTA